MTAKQRVGLGAAVLVAIGVLILAIAIMIFPTVESPAAAPRSAPSLSPAAQQPSPSPTPAAAPSPAPPFKARSLDRPTPKAGDGPPQMRVEFDSGVFLVGQDIAPGKYRSKVPGYADPCIWMFEKNGVVQEWGTAEPGETLRFYIDPAYTLVIFHDCGHLELR